MFGMEMFVDCCSLFLLLHTHTHIQEHVGFVTEMQRNDANSEISIFFVSKLETSSKN